MRKYQMLYILDVALTDEAKEAIYAKFDDVVKSAGGSVEKVDKWGVKKLAYPINYKNEGFYVLMNFEANDKAPAAITAKLNINRDIVRHMIVAK